MFHKNASPRANMPAGGYASKAFYVSSRKIYESAINIVREEGCLPLRYSICAYLRFRGRVSSRAFDCCELHASERNHPNTKPPHYGGDCWVSLKLTEFLFVSSKRNS